MQVQVITGGQATGKTTRLLAIQAELKAQGIEVPIVIGAQCTSPFFVDQITRAAASGAKQFLADDCTPFQIRAARELERLGIYTGIRSDFVVHLVQQVQGGAQ